MATVNVFQKIEMEIDGVKTERGSRSNPTQVTVDGLVYEFNRNLATATTWDVWTAGVATISDWDVLYVESDYDVNIELTCDYGNEVGTVVFAKTIKASCPLMLTHDDALAIYTANFATGSADVIDRIRIRNTSGSTAAVRGLLIT